MIKMISAILLVLSITCSTAIAQDAQQILRNSAQIYSKLKSFHFVGTSQMTVEVDGVKYRMKLPVELAQGNTPDERLTLQSGMPSFEKAIGNSATDTPPLGFSMPNSGYYNFPTLSHKVTSSRIVREEIVETNGKQRRCFVIDLVRTFNKSSSRAERVWIDKASRLVLRVQFLTKVQPKDSQSAHQLDWTTTFTTYKLNGDPPEWLIKMKATREKQLATLRSSKIGTDAPDFTLTTLDGDEVSLRSLRDKIVLLDFWATWCLPCREELPVIAKVEREWGPKGLQVLRITDEDAQLVKEFQQSTRLKFSTLVNGTAATRLYDADNIPTIVVIDKTGKIVAYDVAELKEAELVERLKSAGLDKP